MKYKELGKGIVKRSEKKVVGLFIDGTGLDRATRRLNKRVDMTSLVRGVTSGMNPIVARYYTLIPFEDDSRQRAFLDAVAKAGLTVIVKRLPPIGVNRQVSTDVEMATDMIAFALGTNNFNDLSEYRPESQVENRPTSSALTLGKLKNIAEEDESEKEASQVSNLAPIEGKRSIVAVCPSRDISYAISLANTLNAETTSADFGQLHGGDVLKSAAK